jgi:response regulator NasT
MGPPSHPTSLRIVVADDEPLVRRNFCETLAELGYDVTAAGDGLELVEACSSQLPDLIVADIRMPRLDGIDAAVQIARDRPLPVVLVSGYCDEELIRRAEDSGAMAYLVKPVDKAQLATGVRLAYRRFQDLARLRAELADLRQTLEDRKIIEKAKGLLMRQTGLSEEDALRRMQRTACDTNRKLVAIARDILDSWPLIQPPSPGD